MNPNPLDSVGNALLIAMAKPKINTSNANGLTYRLSCEISEETAKLIGNAKDSRNMLLEASVVLAGYDGHLVGSYMSNVAGQMCGDAKFHQFLQSKAAERGVDIEKGENFAQYNKLPLYKRWDAYCRDWICRKCSVESRRLLDHSDHGRSRFRVIVNEYIEYCQKHRIRCAYLSLVALAEGS